MLIRLTTMHRLFASKVINYQSTSYRSSNQSYELPGSLFLISKRNDYFIKLNSFDLETKDFKREKLLFFDMM